MGEGQVEEGDGEEEVWARSGLNPSWETLSLRRLSRDLAGDRGLMLLLLFLTSLLCLSCSQHSASGSAKTKWPAEETHIHRGFIQGDPNTLPKSTSTKLFFGISSPFPGVTSPLPTQPTLMTGDDSTTCTSQMFQGALSS